MNLIGILFFKTIIVINLCMLSCFALQLSGKCGFPGKPYKSKLDPDNKLYYMEGEEVTYQCLDYWSYIQTRRCVNGKWTGKVARCGEFVNNIKLKYAKLEDITVPVKPVQVFEHINMTLKETVKFPNVFLSKQFNHRLRIFDTRKYRFTLRFTAPVVKLFLKINFNFINYTLLSESEQKALKFNISISVSPLRKCVQEYQTEGEGWWDNGLKIDTFFSCDSLSLKAYEKDVANPSDEMTMETQTSLNISHDFIALYFGKAFGTFEEPICGDPEIPYGQKSRIVAENRDYSVVCADDKNWIYVAKRNDDLPGTPIHKMRCAGDMLWNGSHAECLPSKPCKYSDLLIKNQSLVTSIDNLYYKNRTQWYAVDTSHASYGCAKEEDILFGKDSRVCQKNGSWSGAEPHCYNPIERSRLPLSMIILILGICLVIVIAVTAVIFYYYTKRVKRRITKEVAASANQNAKDPYEKYDSYTEDYVGYDDIGGQPSADGKNLYDTYDTVVDGEVRYAEPYYPNVPQTRKVAIDQSSDDYWRLPANKDSTYLEMTSIKTDLKPLPSPRRSLKKDGS